MTPRLLRVKGAPPGAPAAAETGESAAVAAGRLLDGLRVVVDAFVGEQRLVGAIKAHESFDGILTEHAAALEEIRDLLREDRDAEALERLGHELAYIRALGAVTEEEGQDAHHD